MARPFNPKAIKDRIKENKANMKMNKKAVSDALTAGTKGEEIDASFVRAELASFIRSVRAVNSDTEKLNSIEG